MRDRAGDGDVLANPVGELRTLGNALRVIAELADADEPLAITQLAVRLEMAPSTIHRILATLTAQGYAARVPSRRRYRGGSALTRLARRALVDRARLVEAARPVLEQLAAATGETCHLSVLDGTDTVGIDIVQGSHPVIAHHPVGSVIPAHATAMGQAMLAHLPELTTRIAREGLARFTARTIVDGEGFDRAMAEIRDRGYAVNVGQLHAETAGVGAPIFDAWGAVVAAIGVTGPSARLRAQSRLHALGILARDASVAIGRRLPATSSLSAHDSTASS